MTNKQKAGKTLHLEALRKRVAPHLKKSEIVLFDDSDYNVKEVSVDTRWFTHPLLLIRAQRMLTRCRPLLRDTVVCLWSLHRKFAAPSPPRLLSLMLPAWSLHPL